MNRPTFAKLLAFFGLLLFLLVAAVAIRRMQTSGAGRTAADEETGCSLHASSAGKEAGRSVSEFQKLKDNTFHSPHVWVRMIIRSK